MATAMEVTTTSVTVATMSIKESVTHQFLAVTVGGVGLLLLALSIPRTIAYAYLAAAPARVLSDLNSGRKIDQIDLAKARERYFKALSILPDDAVISQDIGRLDLRRADAPTHDDDTRANILKSASWYFHASIKAAPARPFPWSLDAYVQSQFLASPHEINERLRMSYFLGPREASSILLRVHVGCENWNHLNKDVQLFVSNDLKTLWGDIRLRQNLVPIYLNASLVTRVVIRNVILSDEESEALFNRMLKKALGHLNRS